MLILDPRLISKSAGIYQLNADRNLTELKHLMKDLIIKETPHAYRPTVWASDAKPFSTKSVATQTEAAEGGRMWAYKPKKKKPNSVKTFAL